MLWVVYTNRKKFFDFLTQSSSFVVLFISGGLRELLQVSLYVYESESILQVSFNNKYRAIFFLDPSSRYVCVVVSRNAGRKTR